MKEVKIRCELFELQAENSTANFVLLASIRSIYFFISSEQSKTSSSSASKAPENIEPQSDCEFCGHVGIHEVKCYDEKKKNKIASEQTP